MTRAGSAPGRAPERTPRRLLPEATRPWAVALLTVCLAVVALLGVRYTGQTEPGRLDSALARGAQDLTGGKQPVLNLAVHLGDPIPVAVLAGLLLLGCLVTRRWRGAALVVIALPVAVALTKVLLQPWIHRTLDGGAAFPSGHATGVFALAVTFAVLLADPTPPMPAGVRTALAVAAIATACLVAFALVALDFHYATDTVGGAAVATAVILLTALMLDAAAT